MWNFPLQKLWGLSRDKSRYLRTAFYLHTSDTVEHQRVLELEATVRWLTGELEAARRGKRDVEAAKR